MILENASKNILQLLHRNDIADLQVGFVLGKRPIVQTNLLTTSRKKQTNESATPPAQVQTGPNGLPIEPMVARVQMQLALNEESN